MKWHHDTHTVLYRLVARVVDTSDHDLIYTPIASSGPLRPQTYCKVSVDDPVRQPPADPERRQQQRGDRQRIKAHGHHPDRHAVGVNGILTSQPAKGSLVAGFVNSRANGLTLGVRGA